MPSIDSDPMDSASRNRIGGAFILSIARIIGSGRYLRPEHRNGEGFGFELTRYPVGPGAVDLIALYAGDRHQWPARTHANKIAAAQARHRGILRRGTRLRSGGEGWSRQRRGKNKSERHCDCDRELFVDDNILNSILKSGSRRPRQLALQQRQVPRRPSVLQPACPDRVWKLFKAEPPIRLVWENPAVPLLASMQISAVGLIDPLNSFLNMRTPQASVAVTSAPRVESADFADESSAGPLWANGIARRRRRGVSGRAW